LKRPLAEALLFGPLKEGGTVLFDVGEKDGEEVVLPHFVDVTTGVSV
jgi:hypothetical protein